jgi:hypothetical protein
MKFVELNITNPTKTKNTKSINASHNQIKICEENSNKKDFCPKEGVYQQESTSKENWSEETKQNNGTVCCLSERDVEKTRTTNIWCEE